MTTIVKYKRTRALRPTSGMTLNAAVSLIGAANIADRAALDLYAGAGSFGLRALRLGAARADFVEKSAKHCALINRGLAKHGFDASARARVWRGDVFKIIPKLRRGYDAIFADPPYAESRLEALSDAIAAAGALNADGVLIYEHSARLPTPPILPSGLVRFKLKKYGDSALSVYRQANATADV